MWGGNYGKALVYKIFSLSKLNTERYSTIENTGGKSKLSKYKQFSNGDKKGNAEKFCVFLTSHELSVLE